MTHDEVNRELSGLEAGVASGLRAVLDVRNKTNWHLSAFGPLAKCEYRKLARDYVRKLRALRCAREDLAQLEGLRK